MATIPYTLNGGIPPYTISVKKQGEGFERFRGFSNNIITFEPATDGVPAVYNIVSRDNNNCVITNSFNLSCGGGGNNISSGSVVITPPDSSQSATQLFEFNRSTNIANTKLNLNVVIPCLALTDTKLWILNTYSNYGAFVLREFNINIPSGTSSLIKTYNPIDQSLLGSAMTVGENDTTLYLGGLNFVRKIVLSNNDSIVTNLFPVENGYTVNALVFDPSSNLFLVSYNNISTYKIGLFTKEGQLLKAGTNTAGTAAGFYEFQNEIYFLNQSGFKFKLITSTMGAQSMGNTNLGFVTKLQQVANTIKLSN